MNVSEAEAILAGVRRELEAAHAQWAHAFSTARETLKFEELMAQATHMDEVLARIMRVAQSTSALSQPHWVLRRRHAALLAVATQARFELARNAAH